jgi:hypothetical protein
MGKKNRSKSKARKTRAGRATVDRKGRSGHYQGTNHSEVYRGGKVYVYTAWDDNDEEVGSPMDFNSWVKSVS